MSPLSDTSAACARRVCGPVRCRPRRPPARCLWDMPASSDLRCASRCGTQELGPAAALPTVGPCCALHLTACTTTLLQATWSWWPHPRCCRCCSAAGGGQRLQAGLVAAGLLGAVHQGWLQLLAHPLGQPAHQPLGQPAHQQLRWLGADVGVPACALPSLQRNINVYQAGQPVWHIKFAAVSWGCSSAGGATCQPTRPRLLAACAMPRLPASPPACRRMRLCFT